MTKICIAITNRSTNPFESSIGSDTPLFIEIKQCETSNEGKINESSNILGNLESVCDIEDGDRLTGSEI